MYRYISFIIVFISHTSLYGLSIQDQDFDGVPDSIDQCMHTPFLNQVDATGCTTNILKLPYESETNGLTLALKMGYSTNNDLIRRKNQYTTKIRATFYHNTWSYTFRAGYYTHNQDSGSTDTTLRIKKRISISSKININLSTTINLPTYRFNGNKTDYTFAASLRYYPTASTSLFVGAGHTFIQDKQIFTPLKDTNNFYIGTGYFFTKSFYANLSYTYDESKFITTYAAQSVGTTLYYKINQKWFSTLSYSRQLDEDVHNVLNFTIGYKVW